MMDLIIMRKEFINGNLNGLKDIYSQYRDDVINVVKSKQYVTGQEAEEYFSQSLLVFYERLLEDKNNEIKSVKNYLIGICLNKVKNDICYKSKFKQKAEDVRVLLYEYQEYNCTQNYRDELKKVCQESMAQLDKQCNKIISSYYLDKLSMRQIATSLSLSSSDVAKTLKSRCFKKLINLTKKIQSGRTTC